MAETLHEIKSKAKDRLNIVQKSPYVMFDKKCRLIERYEHIINMCEQLENSIRYIRDDKFFEAKLEDLLIDEIK